MREGRKLSWCSNVVFHVLIFILELAHISGEGVSAEERRASVQEIQEERKKGAMAYVKSVTGALF